MTSDLLSQLEQATSDAQITWIITDALLRTLPPRLAEAALAAAVPHWFDAPILGAVMAAEPAEAAELYAGLQGLSFTERFGTLGHALHDLTRAGILFHLTTARPDLFRHYSQAGGRC